MKNDVSITNMKQNEDHIQHNNKLVDDFLSVYHEETAYEYSTFLSELLGYAMTHEESEDFTGEYINDLLFKFKRLNELVTGLKYH